MKLQAKASFFLSTLLLMILLGQGAIFYFFLDKSLQDSARQNLLENAEQLSTRIDSYIINSQSEILNIAQNLNIQSLPKGQVNNIETFLQSAFISNSHFDNGYFILDGTGNLIVDYPASDSRGKNFAFREYFQNTLTEKKPVISSPYRSKRTGAMVITFTAPLISYEGRFWGLLAGSSTLLRSSFAGGLREIHVGKTGQIILYDSNKTILFHSNSDLITKEGSPPRPDPGLRDLPLESNNVVERRTPDGTEVVLAFFHLQTIDWIVGVMQNKEEVMAPLISLRRQIALFLIIAMGLAIGIGIWAMGLLARPIKALSNSIEQYKGGNWEEPAGLLSRRDEIGALGQSFKNMTSLLSKTLDSLGESESKYRALVEESMVGVFLIQEKQFVFVNPRVAELFGYHQEEMISTFDPLDLVAPVDRDRVLGIMTRPLAENQPMTLFYWQGVRKDGSLIDIETMGGPIRYQGEPAVQGTLVDITERRRAEAALSQKTETLEFLRTLSEDINRTLDLNEVLNQAIDHVLQKTGAEMGEITVLNEQEGVLEFLVRRGYDSNFARKISRLGIGEGICGRVVQTGEPMIVADYASHPQAVKEAVTLGKIRAIASFPLKILDRTIGTLDIVSSKPREFSEEEIAFYRTVSPIIAGAINNATIYRQTLSLNAALEELSRKDGLTGVFNRRYLEEKLTEEIARCERHGGYLGMMMIDMDDFKGINDTLGHEVGDQVLKKVATLLLESCRQIDIVGRFGGDEFLVLLFQTPYEEARQIAERIKRQVQEIEIPGWNRPLSLSIGVASENQEYRNILRLADDRMYEQKKKSPLMPYRETAGPFSS